MKKPKMASIQIRQLEDEVKEFLRMESATNSRSMEAEARYILTWYAKQKTQKPIDLINRLHKDFQKIGGIDDLEIPTREKMPEPVVFKQ
jgi:plasmid stability protein